MESELDRKALDKLIGPTTMRTKGTVEQLGGEVLRLARLRWAFVRRRPLVRVVVAVAVVVAVVAGVSLAVLEPAPSRTAEHRAGDHAGRAPPGPARPKTMVVFDELPLTSLMGPGERIDASRYPAFGRLARDATWYRRATAVHDSTALAVPAILDGRYPRPGLRSDVYSHPANLFTLLERRYEVHAFEEATGPAHEPLRAAGRHHGEPPVPRQAWRASVSSSARLSEGPRRRCGSSTSAAARPVAVLSVRAPLSPECAGADPRAERRARSGRPGS